MRDSGGVRDGMPRGSMELPSTHLKLERGDGHGNLPCLEDFGMDFSNESHWLVFLENPPHPSVKNTRCCTCTPCRDKESEKRLVFLV